MSIFYHGRKSEHKQVCSEWGQAGAEARRGGTELGMGRAGESGCGGNAASQFHSLTAYPGGRGGGTDRAHP